MLNLKTLCHLNVLGFSVLIFTACSTSQPETTLAQAPMMKKGDHAAEDDHAPFGHASAQYVCGGKELLTNYSKVAMTLTYDGDPTQMTRSDTSDLDVFEGALNGLNVAFDGTSHATEFRLGDRVMSCEKLTCVPLDGPL